MKEITFTAYGIPQPKGSTKSFPFRKKDGKLGVSTTSTNKAKLTTWAEQVMAAAREHIPETLFDGPVGIRVEFVLVKPKSVKRKTPTVKPDIDKLARGLLDSLKGVIYTEDARVVLLMATKVYGEPAGARITVYDMTEVV